MSVFEEGIYPTTFLNVETSDKTLLVVTPTLNGTFPVLLFLHGFYLRNYFYKSLLKHVSSHGFIVVAPQLYLYLPPSGTEEIDLAAKVTNWLSTSLQSILPQEITANLLKLGLAGHSRGGKAAFSLALQYDQTTLPFSALLGLDPVAGLGKCCQTEPKILTYVPQSLNLSIPVSVIGTGLGDVAKLCVPCAPNGVNHKEFFYECKPPCSYFVTKDYGHMDMLDDNLPGIVGPVSVFACKSGEGDKDKMRKCVGGIIVAFLRAYLEGKSEDLMGIIGEPDIAPVKLDPVQFIGA